MVEADAARIAQIRGDALDRLAVPAALDHDPLET
jgi:hypothetical protein